MDKSQVKTYTFRGEVMGLTGGLLQPPERARTFQYGRLTKSPYVERNLWFVDLLSSPINARTFTCLVDEVYAQPEVFEDYGWNSARWEKIAHQTMYHYWGWDYFNECMWIESPIKRFALPDGNILRFGYSRTQSEEHPKRELWYMSMFAGYAVIVDRECLEPGFILKMHSGEFDTGREPNYWWRWVYIAWCHIISDAIGSGDGCRSANSFAPRPLDLVSEGRTPNIYEIIELDQEIEKNRRRWKLW